MFEDKLDVSFLFLMHVDGHPFGMKSSFLNFNRHTFVLSCAGLVMLTVFVLIFARGAIAAPNFQINYQGKLTNSSNVAVPNGTYNMRFWLLSSSTAGTTTALWNETYNGAYKVTVTSGLFSVMLGASTSLAGVDFNQTLYLGVEIGSSTSNPAWDGEMSPRKVLGVVPAAFEADRIDGLTSSQFLRSDTSTTLASSSASTLLTITQSGVGDILNIFDNATEVFTVLDGGKVGIGTSTPSARLSITGTSTDNGFLFRIASSTERSLFAIGNNGQIVASSTATSTFANGIDIETGCFAKNGVCLSNISTLAALTDVNVTGVASGSILVYNGTTWLDQATSSLGIDIADTRGTLAGTRGGTGISSITANQLLIGSTGGGSWTQTATSSLGIDISDTRGILATSRGGTGVANLGGANTVLYTTSEGTLASSTNLVFTATGLGIGTSTPTARLSITGTSTSNGPLLRISSSTESILLTLNHQGYFGLGTTSPSALLALTAQSDQSAPLFRISSSTEGAIFEVLGDGSLDIGSGAINYDAIANVTSIERLNLGAVEFEVDGGMISWVDLTASSAPTSSVLSYSAQIDANPLLTVYGVSTGQGTVASTAIGIGSTTPNARFSIVSGSEAYMPIFQIASGTAATSSYLTMLADGRLGLGTSTPVHTLTVAGNARITRSLFDSYNTAGTLGQVLMTTATGTQWVSTSTLGISAGAATLATLTDVNVTGVASGSVLMYDATSGTWLDQATSSLGIDIADTRGTLAAARGGTGLSTVTANQLLIGNTGGTGWTQMASSSLGIDISDTRGILATSRGGTGVANLGGANTVLYTTSEGTLASSTNLTFSGTKLSIGSTTPNALLTVTNSVGTAANTPLFQIASTTGGTATSTLFSVRANGYVGIGVTNPSYLLDVNGVGQFQAGGVDSLSAQLVFSPVGNSGQYLSAIRTSHSASIANNNAMEFMVSNTAGVSNSIMTLLGTGNIGIGSTTPNARLAIMGSSTSNGLLFQIASSTNNPLLSFTADGLLGLGSTSPQSLLTMQQTSGLTGNVVAGTKQFFNFTNSTESALYYGNNTYMVNAPTATSTLVGSVIRVQDNSGLGNTIRGLEVQTGHGTTTQGENTALSGFARTFGVRGSTNGTAGSTYLPAGVLAETTGTTQGNALRAYSGSITTEDLVSFFHDTSDFTGTGLLMNFGNANGSFATSSNYVEFQRGGTTVFKVSQAGSTTIGDGTTNNPAGLMIGYGGLCVDNDGTCHASTTGKITSVSSAFSNSDLAEMYFSSEELEPGDIVYATGIMGVGKARGENRENVIGVVSTKPGITLGFDDRSIIGNQSGYPIALSGRVPIKLSTENGPIKVGDKIMLSSIPGVGMKADGSGLIVGVAIEDFDGEHAYSLGFINQFGDDIAEPKYDPEDTNDDPRTQDGCYYGGGSMLGEETCDPEEVSSLIPNPTPKKTKEEAMQEALLELSEEEAFSTTTPNGQEVELGQSLMFVNLSWHQIAPEQNVLAELLSTSTLENGNGEETLWDRIKTLASNFVDGVLTITGLKTDRVETKELCVDDVCVTADDLRALLNSTGQSSSGGGTSSGSSEGGTTPENQDDSSDNTTNTGTSSGGGTEGGNSESIDETSETDGVEVETGGDESDVPPESGDGSDVEEVQPDPEPEPEPEPAEEPSESESSGSESAGV